MKARLSAILILCLLVALFVPAKPVLAMSNPDSIAFGTGSDPTYAAFYNVYESGDMLFAAEGFVNYSVTQNITASQAFLFEVLNASGNVTLLSTPLTSYGDRPIGIYVTAAQVTSLGLVNNSAYILRITGNPLIFASSTNNTVSATLGGSTWYNDTVGVYPHNSFNDVLRMWVIGNVNGVAVHMQNYDGVGATTPYITYIQGYNYLTTTGGNLFLSGIPGLNLFCPILFQASLERLTAPAPTGTGAGAANLTAAGQLGPQIGGRLSDLGSWLGVPTDMAGSMILLVVTALFCAYIFRRTESSIAVLVIGAAAPMVGTYMGIMPMALAFTATIFIFLLTMYYFFTRGIL